MKKATVWTIGNGAMRRAAWLTLATAAAMVMTSFLAGSASAVDGREIARDQRDRRQDRADVRQLERLMDRMEDAQRARAWREEQLFRRQIHRAIRRELEEGRRDVFADRREVGTEPSRQGRWDDRKDFRESRRRLQRQHDIARELRRVQDDILRGSWRARARERALLGEFLRLMRQDARASVWELREDRRDFRDRRGDDQRERG